VWPDWANFRWLIYLGNLKKYNNSQNLGDNIHWKSRVIKFDTKWVG
jgi:hypothetical protein